MSNHTLSVAHFIVMMMYL